MSKTKRSAPLQLSLKNLDTRSHSRTTVLDQPAKRVHAGLFTTQKARRVVEPDSESSRGTAQPASSLFFQYPISLPLFPLSSLPFFYLTRYRENFSRLFFPFGDVSRRGRVGRVLRPRGRGPESDGFSSRPGICVRRKKGVGWGGPPNSRACFDRYS